MPLRWARHVTRASQIMLPSYVLFFTVVGCSLAFSPETLLRKTPVFAYASSIANLKIFGLAFLAMGVLMVIALVSNRLDHEVAALAVCALWMLAWMVLTIIAIFKGEASYGAWSWPYIVMAATVASAVSVAKNER